MLQERCGQDVCKAQIQAEIWALGPDPEFNIVCITKEQKNNLND